MKQLEGLQTSDYIFHMILSEIYHQSSDKAVELTQDTLAEQLGVSRMPVREALLLLSHDGYVNRRRSRHIHTYPFNQDMLKENIQLLAGVEKILLLQLQQKKVCVDELALLLSAEDKNFSPVQFHRTVGSLSDNPYTRKTLENMIDGYYSLVLEKQQESGDLKALLWKIVEALRNGSREELCQAVDGYYQLWIEELINN